MVDAALFVIIHFHVSAAANRTSAHLNQSDSHAHLSCDWLQPGNATPTEQVSVDMH